MHLLLVAPGRTGVELNQIPEIREITRLHRTTVLNGPVTIEHIEASTRNDEYDIIHFATHTINDGQWDKLALSDGLIMNMHDIGSVARMASAQLVFFNMCNSARFATYLVAHGITNAVYTTLDLDDADAWRMPLRFYQHIARQEQLGHVDFFEAFRRTHPNGGIYGYISDGSVENDLAVEVSRLSEELSRLSEAVQQNRKLIERSNNGVRTGDPWTIAIAALLAVIALLIFVQMVMV